MRARSGDRKRFLADIEPMCRTRGAPHPASACGMREPACRRQGGLFSWLRRERLRALEAFLPDPLEPFDKLGPDLERPRPGMTHQLPRQMKQPPTHGGYSVEKCRHHRPSSANHALAGAESGSDRRAQASKAAAVRSFGGGKRVHSRRHVALGAAPPAGAPWAFAPAGRSLPETRAQDVQDLRAGFRACRCQVSAADT